MALIGWMRPYEADPEMHYQHQALTDAGCNPIYQAELMPFTDLIAQLNWSDTIVVTRFEVLGSSLSEVLARIAQIHEECAFVRALDQGLDSGKNDQTGKILINLLGVFAEVSRNLHEPLPAPVIPSKARAKGRGGRKAVIPDEIKASIRAAVEAGESQYSQAKKYGISRTSVLRMMRGEQ